MKKLKLKNHEGRPVPLGAELGRGGEGSVFALDGPASLVAKIYHQPASDQKAAKLAAMIQQKSEDLLKVAAWPVDTLHEARGGRTVGLLMPRISGYKEIHTLYGPKSRLAEFPHATWKFLVHAATNLARAVAVVHAAGNVVGDINHGNILVSDQATVKLIDCDSFQITAGGRTFLCEVGVSTHTPPELQGLSLRTVRRTPNHDAFGLAVVIFQLLFLARHPFSGTYLGAGHMTLEKAIGELRFAYGSAAASRQMRQPPHTPSLALFPPPLVQLFERAFSPAGVREGGRPRAHEWVETLEGLELRTCVRKPAHVHLSTQAACPWCTIEAQTGVLLFKGYGLLPQARRMAGAFDLDAAWDRITAVASPGALPAVVTFPSAPSQDRGPSIGWSNVIIGGLFSTFGLFTQQWFAVFTVCFLMGIPVLLWWRARRRALDCRARVARLERAWHRQAGDSAFRARLHRLAQARAAYLDLPNLRQRRLVELQADLQRNQLSRFLDRSAIGGTPLDGLDPGWVATLQSYGIETAADVVAADLAQVPGLDPALASRLLHWRQTLERGFVFDASKGIDADDLEALDHTVDAIRTQLEQDLLAGPEQLRKLGEKITERRRMLLPDVMVALKDLAGAESTLRFLSEK